MTADALLTVCYEALSLAVLLSVGPALAAFAASLLVAALQSATQMQDVTLTFVPKIAAALAAVAGLGTWMATELSGFTTTLFALLPEVAHQGT